MFQRIASALAALVLTITLTMTGAEARRVALVIGQDTYSNIGQDAEGVSRVLTFHDLKTSRAQSFSQVHSDQGLVIDNNDYPVPVRHL